MKKSSVNGGEIQGVVFFLIMCHFLFHWISREVEYKKSK